MPISTVTHVLMVAYVAACCALVLLLGARARRGGGDDRVHSLGRYLGVTMLALWVVYNAYYFSPSRFDPAVSFPLHACDVLAGLAGVVLLWPFRWGRAVLFFSAISLSTQAIVTPTGNQDPTTARFWLYWTLHAGIVACSLFDLAIRRYRPTPGDLLRVYLVDAAYFALVFPLDVLFSWNYGYVGPPSLDTPTVLDLLGPWPLRALWVMLLAMLAQGTMLALWALWCSVGRGIARRGG